MGAEERRALMVYRGDVLPVGALLEHALASPAAQPAATVGLRHTAAGNAALCSALIAAGEPPDQGWRFGVLQTVDDYSSTLRRDGPSVAAQVFTDEPAPTGSTALDAAFAALAEHLAERDGWPAPAWAADPARRTDAWYPDVPAIFRAEAERDSPSAFRSRGIWITARSLERA
jgi:hypothetical protein